MGERIYLSWTISNWITVILMVIIAWLVVNLAVIGYKKIGG